MRILKNYWREICILILFTYLGNVIGLAFGIALCLLGWLFEKIITKGE